MDKSLEEIILAKKKQSARGRGGAGRSRGGRGRGSRGGSFRGAGGAGGGFKSFKRQSTDQVQGKWQNDMFQNESPGRGRGTRGGRGRGGAGGESQTKLMISNLDYGVSTDDIKELFAEFGRVTKAHVHYDASGRSLGTATVFYMRYVDAKKAVDQYNNVPLDGRPMTVQIVSDQPMRQQAVANGTPAKQRVGTVNAGGAGGGRGRGGRGRGRGGRGRGGRGAKTPVPTLDELNADLDAYNKQMEA